MYVENNTIENTSGDIKKLKGHISSNYTLCPDFGFPKNHDTFPKNQKNPKNAPMETLYVTR